MAHTAPRPLAWLLVTLGIAGATIGGTVLRWRSLSEELWLDELHTSWCVAADWQDVAWRAEQGNQPPLYFYVVRSVVGAIGQTPLSLRALSLASGLAWMALAAGLIWGWTRSPPAAVATGILVASDPWMIFYSAEARPYMLLVLISGAQLAVLGRLFGRPDRGFRAVGLAVVLAAVTGVMVQVHYTGLLAIGAELVAFAVIVIWRRTQRTDTDRLTSHAGLAAVGLLVGMAAAGPPLVHLRSIGSHAGDWSSIVDLSTFANQWGRWILVYLLVPLATAMVLRLVRKTRSSDDSPTATAAWRPKVIWFVVLAVAVLPPLVALVGTLTGWAPLALIRFTLVAYVGLVLAAGLCVGGLAGLGRQSAAAVIVIGVALWASHPAREWLMGGPHVPMRNENWREAVAAVNQPDGRDQPVIVFPNLVEDASTANQPADEASGRRAYYTFPVRGIYSVEPPTRPVSGLSMVGSRRFGDADIDAIVQAGGGWLIVRATEADAAGLVDELDRRLAQRAAEANPVSWTVTPIRSDNDDPVRAYRCELDDARR